MNHGRNGSRDEGATSLLAGDPLSPDETVRTVLAAMKEGATAGARALWQVGAARLHRSLRSEEHLAQVLTNDLFAPLLNHERATLLAPQFIANTARLELILQLQGGQARYLIAMVRPGQGDMAGHWLVSGIEREA